MTRSLKGLPLDSALEILRGQGLTDVEVTEIIAPRGNAPRGNLRVVRVKNDGQQLTVARFPDDVLENNAPRDLENE